MGEALVVMMMAMTMRLEVDMGGELHSAIWKALRLSMLAWAFVVMGVGLVLLVAGNLVEALHTEALHLVTSVLGGCLGLSHSRDDLGEDTAQDSLTFGIWRVWRDGNGLDVMKDEMLRNVSFELCKENCKG